MHLLIVEEDANPVDYEGFRASIAHEINDNWDVLATVANQTIDADGVFFVDPTLGDLEIQRYTNDTIEDEFDNMSLTLKVQLVILKFFILVLIQIEQQIRM